MWSGPYLALHKTNTKAKSFLKVFLKVLVTHEYMVPLAMATDTVILRLGFALQCIGNHFNTKSQTFLLDKNLSLNFSAKNVE